jgi:formate dehydrogenase subunit gamma
MATIDRPVSRVGPAEKFGRTTVYEGELLRHSVYNRVVHWAVAIFFILALLSGFALFTPWLYGWVAPLFGSGARARLLHPWFGLGFVIALIFQLRGWYASMRWKDNDSRWLRRIRAYVTNTERAEADDVGKFNGGQKLWFWTMIYSGLVFLITGIPLWFPEVLGRTLMWICYFFHDIAGLVMLAGFIVHIYEGTLAIPGTFRSMTRGTVTRQWGWTHHPAWYRELTGRDARQDREQARRG